MQDQVMQYWTTSRCDRNRTRIPPVTRMTLPDKSRISAALIVDAPNPNMMLILLAFDVRSSNRIEDEVCEGRVEPRW